LPARTSRSRAALPLAVLLALTASCSPSQQRAVERIAILRFENLTGDEALNWMGRAASEVMTEDLAGVRNLWIISPETLHAADRAWGARPLEAPGISTEGTAALLSGANRTLYGRVSRAAGKLRLDATLFDAASQKIERTLSVSGSQGIVPLADALAAQLAERPPQFETRSVEALREYCMALESADPAAATQAFSRSVAADPSFGQAYVGWAQLAARQNNATEAQRILSLAEARANSLSYVDRARLESLAARLRGDFSANARALEKVARFRPADIGLLRQVAQAELDARRFPQAARSLREALTAEPDDVVLLNQLGYAEMYAGRLPAATQSLDEYARLRPDDPNAPDSLGDVNFSFGRFAEAEKDYRRSYGKNKNFNNGFALAKAARARLMTGDIAGADGIFNQYLEARHKAGDAIVEYRRAEWEFLSGRRKQAIARLEAFARGLAPGLAAVLGPEAFAQLAVWELELGDRARARDLALSASPRSGWAIIARFLTEPAAPAAGWSARAEALPADERTRKTALACALLVEKEFPAAERVLLDLYSRSAPEPQEILPVLLAWAHLETGHIAEAAPLVERNPVPNPVPEIFASLAFPRLLYLRAAVLDKQGRHQEAAGNYRLFLALSGPDADIFGEQAKARHALGQ
jgi:tetratricopeptide (TPR) repeat protein